MNMIRSHWRNLSFSERSVPLAFLVAAVLGFGLLAPTLGFYQDDWPYVYYAFNKGIAALGEELYYDSRPNATWLYLGAFHVLGFQPLAWHLFALVLRWLTATVLWLLFRRIWPDHPRAALFTILLFIVHPFFLIQPYAVNSILYWAGYLMFAASLWLMARSVREKNRRLLLTGLAVGLEVVHLFTSEYFAGMVLVRPLILYWLARAQELNGGARIRRVLAGWLPYLGALILYALWRLMLYIPPPIGDRNSPVMLYSLIADPLQTLYALVRTALQDAIIVTFTSWYKVLVPELVAFNTLFDWIALMVVAVAFGLGSLYLRKVSRSFPERGEGRGWPGQAAMLGAALLILGLVPIWIIGQDIVTHKNEFAGSRFGIGSTLGAALIVAAIIEGLIDSPGKKAAVIAACTALAIGMHLNNAQTFSYAWEKQIRFYQELTWRAPELQPGTAVVTDEEILGYMGQYATSFGIITAYQPGNVTAPPYWYFPVYYTYPDINEFVSGIPLEARKLSMQFTGASQNSLVISFNPELDRCLWVLRPEEANLRLISADMRSLSAASNTHLIGDNHGRERALPAAIFGTRPEPGWCYYFEKADLARQFQDWEAIVRLLMQAKASGEQAGNGFEYIPFIEGYAHLGDWDTVRALTRTARRVTSGMEPSLCSTLDRLKSSVPPSRDRDQTILDLSQDLGCQGFE